MLLFILATLSVPLVKILNGAGMIVALSIDVALFIGIVVWMVLSFTVGSNVLLTLNHEGIAKKERGSWKTQRWQDVESINVTREIPIQRGVVAKMMVVHYVDKHTITFEIGELILKDIRRFCGDSRFLALMDEALTKPNG